MGFESSHKKSKRTLTVRLLTHTDARARAHAHAHGHAHSHAHAHAHEVAAQLIHSFRFNGDTHHRSTSCTCIRSNHLEFNPIGKGLGQAAPNSVSIQLQRNTDALDELPGDTNNVAALVCYDTRHLHRVPARTLAHDVSIERVENAFVREL